MSREAARRNAELRVRRKPCHQRSRMRDVRMSDQRARDERRLHRKRHVEMQRHIGGSSRDTDADASYLAHHLYRGHLARSVNAIERRLGGDFVDALGQYSGEHHPEVVRSARRAGELLGETRRVGTKIVTYTAGAQKHGHPCGLLRPELALHGDLCIAVLDAKSVTTSA